MDGKDTKKEKKNNDKRYENTKKQKEMEIRTKLIIPNETLNIGEKPQTKSLTKKLL